jgi:hypothetical protein
LDSDALKSGDTSVSEFLETASETMAIAFKDAASC